MQDDQSNEVKGNFLFHKAQPRNDLSDLRFDLTLTIQEDKLELLAKALEPEFAVRERQRSAKQEKKHRRQLGAIFANGLNGQASGVPVYYPRGHAAYRGDTPEWYSADTIPKSMDVFHRLELISSQVAEAGTYSKNQSTYLLLGKADVLLSSFDISVKDLEVVAADHRFLVIRDQNGMSIKLDRSNEIIAQKIINVEAINDFLSSFEISYISQPVPHLNREALYRVPLKTLGTRIYNGDLMHGGRFFRCFWHNITKEERKTIWIGDSPTVELDYGALFARMGYHEQGIEAPFDPYDIRELRLAAEKQDRDYQKVRGPVKRLMQTGINSMKPLKPYNWQFAGLHDVYIRQANEWIWDANEPIKPLAHSGSGLKMMTWESDLAEQIMLEGMRLGIPVLSVHDSFIVRARDESWLREIMMKVYYKKFSFYPVIK